MNTPTREQMEHLGTSLITFNGDQCLGSLMHFDGHGTFDPTLGKVDVTKAEAETHNVALDAMLIKGLDENCQIGQCGTFYFNEKKVTTFIGLLVSDAVRVNGQSITFKREGKVYRGRLQKHADCFNFKRIS